LRRSIFLAAIVALAGAGSGSPLTSDIVRRMVKPPFTIAVNGYGYQWDNIGRFVMPGDTLWLDVRGTAEHSGFVAAGGELAEVNGQTCWVAPGDPGLYPIMVSCGPALRHINAFVLVPYSGLDKKGYLRGVRMGRYPASSPFPNFTTPRGFVEVTPDNFETPISQRYRLRDLCPQQPEGFPKYVALREELLVKLELLSDFVAEKGYPCERLSILSGFRSPQYNRRNRTGRNSAHVYGGAADLFVDADGDGHMDDLNHDGTVNRRDSKLLAGFVDEFEQRYPELVGGCGWYSRNRWRGPFVHIDVRGTPSRWHQ
jgi:hypothetical protein